MKLSFSIYCHTQWGQNLFLVIAEKRIPMRFTEDFIWQVDYETTARQIVYGLEIENHDGSTSVDARSLREIIIDKTCKELFIRDEFEYSGLNNVFRTLPFTTCYFRQTKSVNPLSAKRGRWLFRVEAPAIPDGCAIGISGSHLRFGEWNERHIIPLEQAHYPFWQTAIDVVENTTPIEYKFVIYNTTTGIVEAWETGDNRAICFDNRHDDAQLVETSFRRDYDWRAAGVAVPVFSLKSAKSWGVGEFLDLPLLADWAAQTGQRMIQILPINDTTATYTDADSYPYRANSVYALHPIYLRPETIALLTNRAKAAVFEKKRQALNAKPFVDYSAVYQLKSDYLHLIYLQEQEAISTDSDFQHFCEENADWLLPYAVYSVLRDRNTSPRPSDWTSMRQFRLSQANKFAKENALEVGYYYFIQYHLSQQLKQACAYIHNRGVALKGDLPIGISADSVDAWMEPQLFNLDKQAGAPPDDFSERGQNWGFPTYNWEAMASTGYAWWRKRFDNMASYFDAFRIDHILGFFRIWEIPKSAVWGLLGYFNPALPLSRYEIELYGIAFDSERFLEPFITDELLSDLFGEQKKDILQLFERKRNGCFRFKSKYASQQAFLDNRTDFTFAVDARISELVMQLYTEVLFVADARESERYHPRISIYKSRSFEALDSSTQQALRRIYNDFYFRRHNRFWKEQAMRKLPGLLHDNRMLVCGEDLGMVPQSVPEVMSELNILSLEIQRMPKQTDCEFVLPERTPYLSVCSTGTHDMSVLRAWWQEDAARTQRYYNSVLKLPGNAPTDCDTEMCRLIIENVLSSKGMWAILPIQDYLGIDAALRFPHPEAERINLPDNPNNFWSYRMHLSLEQLLGAEAFNRSLRQIVKTGGR